MPTTLTRRHVLLSAASVAAVAAMPAASAIAAVEQAPMSIYGWASVNMEMLPSADVGASFEPYLRSVLDAMAMPKEDVVIITKMPDLAQGAVPRKIDGLAYIRDVAAGRKR